MLLKFVTTKVVAYTKATIKINQNHEKFSFLDIRLEKGMD